MNLFQIIAISVIAVIILVECIRIAGHRHSLLAPAFRLLIWLAALGFIIYPDTLTYIARFLGIGVGSNLLLYLLTFAFLIVSFILYARIVQLRRQLTLLVRHLALERPLPPPPPKVNG